MSTAVVQTYSQTRSRLISDNVISLWGFNDDVVDSIGTNDGVYLGNNNYTTGLIVRALNLAHSTSVVEVNNDISLSFNDGVSDVPKSISFLFKFTSSLATSVFINKRSSVATDNEYQLFYSSNGFFRVQLFSGVSSNRINITKYFSPVVNEWYHFTFTYDGSGSEDGLNLMINGDSSGNIKTQDGTYTGSPNTISKLYIGERYDDAAHFFGEIDELKFFNIELTPEETLYLATEELAGRTVI